MSNQYPDYIMEILRQRNDLEPDDNSEDVVILDKTNPQRAFNEVMAWRFGSAGWGYEIINIIKACGGNVVWSKKTP